MKEWPMLSSLPAILRLRSSFLALRGRPDRGATAVEYGLIVALIAIAVIATVWALGQNLEGLFGDAADEVQNPDGQP
jgi:pilus assembly protein Flp/PilA